jgi:hypothetical protein
MISHTLKKWAGALALIGIFMFAGTILFQLQVAFGWTSPAANPPGGAGALYYLNSKVGVNTQTPSTTLTVSGQISASGNRIRNVATPIDGDDAVNKDYVLAQTGGGAGAGSLVLYYREIVGTTAAPTCPTGWTPQYVTPGYGPHYIGMFNYGWLTSTGGQGGFGGTGAPPPSAGTAYTLNSIAIASDSVCSQDQTTIVPFGSFYQNTYQPGFSSHTADACFTDTSVTPNVTTCNRCVVCQK